jgi:hypothetical protein
MLTDAHFVTRPELVRSASAGVDSLRSILLLIL